MTEQETREKIFNIVREFNVQKRRYSTHTEPSDDDELADALIEAGIGDVQSLVDGTCVLCVKDKGIMRLYNEQEINEMIHRKEVAERALLLACTNVIKDEEDDLAIEPRARVLYKAYLKQAEKELAEERKDD